MARKAKKEEEVVEDTKAPRRGMPSVKEAAAKLGMSEAEFRKTMDMPPASAGTRSRTTIKLEEDVREALARYAAAHPDEAEDGIDALGNGLLRYAMESGEDEE